MICVVGLLLGTAAASVDLPEPKKLPVKIRYKSAKEINFEELLIQGKLVRPNLSVVTGSVGNDDAGLLRLRKDFLDRVAMDFGEEVK